MFWAATCTAVPWQRCSTWASHVNGGQTTTSEMEPSTRGKSMSRYASTPPFGMFIFQLAARIGVRSGISESLHSGELASLDQFQGGAAARRDPIDRIGEAELVQGRDGIATPHDRVPRRGCDRLRD